MLLLNWKPRNARGKPNFFNIPDPTPTQPKPDFCYRNPSLISHSLKMTSLQQAWKENTNRVTQSKACIMWTVKTLTLDIRSARLAYTCFPHNLGYTLRSTKMNCLHSSYISLKISFNSLHILFWITHPLVTLSKREARMVTLYSKMQTEFVYTYISLPAP